MRGVIQRLRSGSNNEEDVSNETSSQTEEPQEPEEEENEGMNDLMKAIETSPPYTSPVLFEDEHVRTKISHALRSSNIQSVNFDLHNFGTNEPHISLYVDSELRESQERIVTIRIEIGSFTDWAAESRLEDTEDGEIHEYLGLNGPYYVDISNEIEQLIDDIELMDFRRESYDSESDIAVFSYSMRVRAYDETILFTKQEED